MDYAALSFTVNVALLVVAMLTLVYMFTQKK